MAKNQKSYTPEFKQQIVDLYKALQKVGVTEDVPGDLSKKTIRRPASAGRFCVGTSDNVMKNIVVEECNICYN